MPIEYRQIYAKTFFNESMNDKKKTFENQSVVFTGRLFSMPRKEAQELVKANGGCSPNNLTKSTDFLVVGSEGYLTEIDKSSKLEKAETLQDNGGKVQIISESSFLEMVNLESRYQLEKKYYPLTDVLDIYKNIRKDHVRYFQKWGILKPEVRANNEQFFHFKDLLLFRKINNFLAEGKKIRTIAKGLHAELFPSNQLKIEFEDEKPRGKVLELKVTEPPKPVSSEISTEEWFEIGSKYDNDLSTYDQAIVAYEKAVAQDPEYFPALVNLANLYFEKGEIEKAKSLYLRAYQIEPTSHKLLFNIGNLYDELGDFDNALQFFQKATEQFPLYADAHFNMAVVYEKIGLISKAKEHWKAYLQIDNAGEWAEIAEEHLSEL